MRLTHFVMMAAIAAQTAGGQPVFPQPAHEQPVGIILQAAGARLQRPHIASAIEARTGDVMFAGDRLRALAQPVRFAYCPESVTLTLEAGGEARFEANRVTAAAGALEAGPKLPLCLLPPIVRVSNASSQHYGGGLVRPLIDVSSLDAPLSAERRQALDAALQDLQEDVLLVRIRRAELLASYAQKGQAANAYRLILQQWPGAVWAFSRLFELEPPGLPEPPAAPMSTGRTYALLIGISRYQSADVSPLLYADRDAEIFHDFLRSERGGAIPEPSIRVLTNEKATTASVRLAFQEFLQTRATRDDTVIVLIAAHGTVQTIDGRSDAYLVTHDTDPQDLARTALPMSDLAKLLGGELSGVRRIVLYLDACRAGQLGVLRTRSIHPMMERFASEDAELFAFLASGKDEVAREGPEFGGGHGAFSYFVLDALNGSADEDANSEVDFNEFVDYVRRMVREATDGRQRPRERGDLGNLIMSDLRKPGLDLRTWRREDEVRMAAVRSLPPPAVARFRKAVEEGRILHGEPGSAFEWLPDVYAVLPAHDSILEANRLRAALEDRIQQVLLRYLAGEQTPQTESDFAACAMASESALRLTPESVLLRSRLLFCRGRELLFGKQYTSAQSLLESAVALDSEGAHAFNALGIAYLEQARYEEAARAFTDAIRRAPFWAYPRHNAALTRLQAGDYQAAIDGYREAMRLAPRFAYLPYNLGLIYQRMNRPREAEAEYARARALDPDLAQPLDGLGTLATARGRAAEAEVLFRGAMSLNPELASARHNLAVLLARDPARFDEAVALWRANLQGDPGFLASRVSLAEALAARGRAPEAIPEYERLLQAKPDFVAGRLALARLYRQGGEVPAARTQIGRARTSQPRSPAVYEELGDLEASQGRFEAAAEAYGEALRWGSLRETGKRLRDKRKRALRGQTAIPR